uniref:Uncharacterized protein n=1 Tax=Aegilops tauschii subsp. strangulata TaxID=200361 RepID=A0A453J4W3_AEGTS
MFCRSTQCVGISLTTNGFLCLKNTSSLQYDGLLIPWRALVFWRAYLKLRDLLFHFNVL